MEEQLEEHVSPLLKEEQDNEHAKKFRYEYRLDFDRRKIDEKTKVICKVCKKVLGGKISNGATYLMNHTLSCPLRKLSNINFK